MKYDSIQKKRIKGLIYRESVISFRGKRCRFYGNGVEFRDFLIGEDIELLIDCSGFFHEYFL